MQKHLKSKHISTEFQETFWQTQRAHRNRLVGLIQDTPRKTPLAEGRPSKRMSVTSPICALGLSPQSSARRPRKRTATALNFAGAADEESKISDFSTKKVKTKVAYIIIFMSNY